MSNEFTKKLVVAFELSLKPLTEEIKQLNLLSDQIINLLMYVCRPL